MPMFRVDFKGFAFVEANDPEEALGLFEDGQQRYLEIESTEAEEQDDWDLEV